MGWNSWTKLGKPKPSKPKKKKTAPAETTSTWDRFKRAGGTAMTLGTGVAAGSMIPFAASKSTEQDIERMKNYEPSR